MSYLRYMFVHCGVQHVLWFVLCLSSSHVWWYIILPQHLNFHYFSLFMTKIHTTGFTLLHLLKNIDQYPTQETINNGQSRLTDYIGNTSRPSCQLSKSSTREKKSSKIKSWPTFCDPYFWKFPIWNSRADEKRREIRMVNSGGFRGGRDQNGIIFELLTANTYMNQRTHPTCIYNV
jgi:hypothetical protein